MTTLPVNAERLSVVVCAFTFDRLELTTRCVHSVLSQEPPPERVIVVIDHNEALFAAMKRRFPDVTVVPNQGLKGLSGGRNTGIANATGDFIAFVDDDAVPRPGWLAAMTAGFDDPAVVGVGGHAEPDWDGEKPDWFPDEYLWVVGCSYEGLRAEGPVRNPLGCNMAFRRTVFEVSGGFNEKLGRIGTLPFGCEETEFSVRALRLRPDASIVMVRGATVSHRVTTDRKRVRYLFERCFYEGVGKALLTRLTDNRALSAERSYAARTIPRAVGRELVRAVRLDRPLLRLGRAAILIGGLVAAGLGYVRGSIMVARTSPETWIVPAEPAAADK